MKDELENGIYVSIKLEPVSKIVQKSKKYEFRNYVPKRHFKFLYVYVPAPQSQLKYIMEIGEVIKYPEKLEGNEDGDHEFNMGQKSKYAYSIIRIYELLYPISLKELRTNFGFIPPQAFTYSDTFPELTEYIVKAKKKLI